MGIGGIAAVLASAVLTAGTVVPGPVSSEPASVPTGLWSTEFAAQQNAADCGQYRLDANKFCVADDSRNGLEVGVRFQTSTELQIIGVRIYRVDPGTVRASLWESDGTLLARGDFPAGITNTWQDMSFAAPVTIVPGKTYVASYFTPATKYAFRYRYFEEQGRTVGPVTAPRSGDEPNGVHCYDDAVCGSFPVRGFRDTSYWVTPLWLGSGGDAPDPPPPGDPTTDRVAPRVTAAAPARDARRVKVGAKVAATFSEPVRPSTLTRTMVRLVRKGGAKPVRAKLAYDAERRRVVLDPRSALRPATTYVVTITTGVRDVAGNQLDQDPGRDGRQKATWKFRTRR